MNPASVPLGLAILPLTALSIFRMFNDASVKDVMMWTSTTGASLINHQKLNIWSFEHFLFPLGVKIIGIQLYLGNYLVFPYLFTCLFL